MPPESFRKYPFESTINSHDRTLEAEDRSLV